MLTFLPSPSILQDIIEFGAYGALAGAIGTLAIVVVRCIFAARAGLKEARANAIPAPVKPDQQSLTASQIVKTLLPLGAMMALAHFAGLLEARAFAVALVG